MSDWWEWVQDTWEDVTDDFFDGEFGDVFAGVTGSFIEAWSTFGITPLGAAVDAATDLDEAAYGEGFLDLFEEPVEMITGIDVDSSNWGWNSLADAGEAALDGDWSGAVDELTEALTDWSGELDGVEGSEWVDDAAGLLGGEGSSATVDEEASFLSDAYLMGSTVSTVGLVSNTGELSTFDDVLSSWVDATADLLEYL